MSNLYKELTKEEEEELRTSFKKVSKHSKQYETETSKIYCSIKGFKEFEKALKEYLKKN